MPLEDEEGVEEEEEEDYEEEEEQEEEEEEEEITGPQDITACCQYWLNIGCLVFVKYGGFCIC